MALVDVPHGHTAGLLSFLECLPPATADAVYASTWTCAALVRALPPLAKHTVLRLVHVDTAVALGDIRAWARPEVSSQQEAALNALRSLRVLLPGTVPGGASGEGLRLNPAVQAQLRQVLYDTAPVVTPELPAELQAQAPGDAQLSAFANDKWEQLLLFLVGAGDALKPEHGSTLDVEALLQGAGLKITAAEAAASAGVALDADADPNALVVSDAGFRYLLLERSQQLWLLLQHYVTLSAVPPTSAGDDHAAAAAVTAAAPGALSLLLRLSFLPKNVPHLAPDDSLATQRLLADMCTLGMVYLIGHGSHSGATQLWYCVTPLAAAVAAGLAGSGGSRNPHAKGHIIVETNFRVYAYTASLIELAVLNLFVRAEYRLPNLFVGVLTRDSVTSAQRSGISGDQIVEYLQQHAHPAVLNRVPAVPETVCDQIRLWAKETQRMRASPAALFDDFPNQAAYNAAKRHALQLGALLWADDAKCTFVTRNEVRDSMRDYFRLARERGEIT